MRKVFIGCFALTSISFVIIAAKNGIYNSNPKCLKLGIFLYEEMNCKPIKEKLKECPSSYNCSHIYSNWSDYNHCIVKGRDYWLGQEVPIQLTLPTCNTGCGCTSRQSQDATIHCASVDCPEKMGTKMIPPNCLYTYSSKGCCATGHICPPFKGLAKCKVGNTTYYENELFYPEKTCLACICKKGFNGKYDKPFCTKHSCGVELVSHSEIRRYCAPIYFPDEAILPCCPLAFFCPPNPTSKLSPPPGSDDVSGADKSRIDAYQYLQYTNPLEIPGYFRLPTRFGADAAQKILNMCKFEIR